MKMKRVAALVLAACMLLSLLPMGSQKVSAAEPVTPLENKKNADVIAAPGVWAYSTPTGVADTQKTAVYSDDSVALVLAKSATGTVELRYQPNFPEGTEYTISFTAVLEGANKITYGAASTKTVTFSGEKEITMDTVVDAEKPFKVAIKEITAEKASLVLKNIKIEADLPAAPETQLQWRDYPDVVANPGVWAYLSPEAAIIDVEQTALYDDGSIKLVIKQGPVYDSATKTNEYLLLYQPAYEVGEYYDISFVVHLEGATKFVFSNDNKSTTTKSACEALGDNTWKVTYTDMVDHEKPFKLALREMDEGVVTGDKEITVTVTELVVAPHEHTPGPAASCQAAQLCQVKNCKAVLDVQTPHNYVDGVCSECGTAEPTTNYVSGVITGANSANVELRQGDVVVYSAAANGCYMFEDVADGDYTLVVSAWRMPTVKMNVNVDGERVVKDVALVDQDSLVTIKNALELEGSIGVHYYLALKDGVTNPTMTAWYLDSEPQEFVGTLRPDGRYGFKFDVYAMEMTDTISAVFTVQKGDVTYELNTYKYTVQDYCLKAFQLLQDTQMKDLMAALLNYGAYAQINFGHSLNKLANAVLPTYGYSTELDSSVIDADERQDIPCLGNTHATYTGNALELNEVIRLRYNFTVDNTVDTEVYFAYSKAGIDEPLTVVKAVYDGTKYSGIIENIGSYEMSDRYEGFVCVYERNKLVQISDTRSFSASCYAYTVSQQTDPSFDNLKNCMVAMMTYGKLAQAKFG